VHSSQLCRTVRTTVSFILQGPQQRFSMPEFSLHLPRFLRFHRSHPHSLKPSPPCPHDDTGVPPSRPVLEQAVHVAYGASCPPVSGHPVDPQNSAGHFFVDRAPDDFGGQALWTPRPIIPIDVGSVTQQPTHLASSCNPTGFVEAQIPLEPQPATYTLTTSPQHSLCSEPLSVSLFHRFYLQMKKLKES
jgi:hypothetical protein